MIAINGAGGAVGQPVGQTTTDNDNVDVNSQPATNPKPAIPAISMTNGCPKNNRSSEPNSTPATSFGQILLKMFHPNKYTAYKNCKTALEKTFYRLSQNESTQNESTSVTKDYLLGLLDGYFKDSNSSAKTLNTISNLLTSDTVTNAQEATVLITFLIQNSSKAFEGIENFSKGLQMFIMEAVNQASTPESKVETLNKGIACANCHMAFESLALKINLTSEQGEALLDQLYGYLVQPNSSAKTFENISILLKPNFVKTAQDAEMAILCAINNRHEAFEKIKSLPQDLQNFIMDAVDQASTLAEKQTTLNKGIACANCYVALKSLLQQRKLTPEQADALLDQLYAYFDQPNSSAETLNAINEILNSSLINSIADIKFVINTVKEGVANNLTNFLINKFLELSEFKEMKDNTLVGLISGAINDANDKDKLAMFYKCIAYGHCYKTLESLLSQDKSTQDTLKLLLYDYLNESNSSAENLNGINIFLNNASIEKFEGLESVFEQIKENGLDDYLNTQIEALTPEQNFIASAAKAASTLEDKIRILTRGTVGEEILKTANSLSYKETRSSAKRRQMIIDIVEKHGGIDNTVLIALLKDPNCTRGVKVALLQSNKLNLIQKFIIKTLYTNEINAYVKNHFPAESTFKSYILQDLDLNTILTCTEVNDLEAFILKEEDFPDGYLLRPALALKQLKEQNPEKYDNVTLEAYTKEYYTDNPINLVNLLEKGTKNYLG